MGKQRRGRGGSASSSGGMQTPQGGHGGKGNRAAKVYAGGRPRRAGLARGNAIIVVVARKGGREIERWEGNMNWPGELGELPVAFVGRRAGNEWIWNDRLGETVCLYSARPDVCGVEIKPWAYQRGATELMVRIVAKPGAKAADASAQGLDTQGQDTGQDARDRALAEMYSDMLSPAARAAGNASGSGDASRSVDESFRDVFADMLGREAHEAGRDDGSAEGVGLGEQGAGSARGMSGERPITGRGQDAGEPAGQQGGSISPSWYTRAGAVVDDESGGRTPDLEHGKPGGSAGGQQGGEGHLAGIWNGPIDIAATVAIAVNVVLVFLDADVNGLGGRFLGKVVGGLAGKRLRKELAEEATRVIDGLMPQVEKELAKDAAYQAMSKAEKAAVLAQARERLKREYHARARAYFGGQAQRSEAIVQTHADEAGEVAAHHGDTAAANARAYRELEQAAADNGGLDIDDHIDAAWVRQGRTGEGVEAESMHATSARGAGVTRNGLTERHHVLPQEHKKWFQERGFPGNDIDAYCVQIDMAEHQALHGGGNPRLGRQWRDEWNKKVKEKLDKEERRSQRRHGRKLNREEVLAIIRKLMNESPILRNRPFIHYRAKQ
jgi:hypothetical protein